MIRHLKSLTLMGLAALAAPTLAQRTPATGSPAATGAPSEPLDGKVGALVAEADAAYARRDEPGELDKVKQKLTEAERLAPSSYPVLWRLARYYFWLSDDPNMPDDEKSRLGKQGWDFGDRATQANQGAVEGWFFAAGGLGNYALGIGIMKALSIGLEGKLKDRLSRAERIDPKYLNGGIYNAWGRFYFKLPWPKYDPRRSEAYLRKAIAINPANVRARVYLAELYEKEDHPKEARKALEEALAQPKDAYDEPEERRYQDLARALLAKMK